MMWDNMKVPCSINADLVFSYIAFPKNNLKFPIVWADSFAPIEFKKDYREWQGKMIKERRHSVERASAIVTSPEISVEYFCNMFPFASSKVYNIPYFLPYLDPVGIEEIDSKFDNIGKIKMIFVGKGAKRKGLDTIIDAFNRLSFHEKSCFDITVVSSMIDGKLNIPPEFKYYSFVDDVISEIKKNHILMLPTKSESYGLVLQEAMALGCAIITTNAPIQKSLVGESGGIFINPFDHNGLNNSFKKILKNKGILKPLAIANLHRFNRVYHPKVVGEKYYNLFMKILK
jgi:glycosyltransferase involved in cell wall biosynthesis